jgi:hypothetical protein
MEITILDELATAMIRCYASDEPISGSGPHIDLEMAN